MSTRTLGPTAVAGLLSLLLGTAVSAATLPPGRAWAPVVELDHPDVAEFQTTTMLRDPSGGPVLVAGARRHDSAVARWAILAWKDSVWGDSVWSAERSGLPPTPALDTDGGTHLVSVTPDADVNGYPRLALWSLKGSIASPETVAVTTSQLSPFAYSAAITAGRRWVARAEQRPNEDFRVRTYLSDAVGDWQEAPQLGYDILNCAIAPLDDTTALLVYTGFSSTNWARLEGNQWSASFPFPRLALAPRFVRNPTGGWWLVSAGQDAVHVDAWTGTGWSPASTLQAIRDPGRGFQYVGWCEPAVESRARPAIAWQEDWAEGIEWHTEGHVAWPTETGWSPGYQIPQSDAMTLGPTVTLDANGDAWLAWSLAHLAAKRWTHTYVAAKTNAPLVTLVDDALRIAWDLTEPAPLSRWTVLRDTGTGTFEAMETVTAGWATTMQWLDETPPPVTPEPLRYRIRRESVDTRYAWESAVTEFARSVGVAGAGAASGALRLAARANPTGSSVVLELRGASPGEIELLVFDVTGRLLSRQRAAVRGIEVEFVRLDLGSARRGVVLVRASEADGRTAPPLKLVRLDD